MGGWTDYSGKIYGLWKVIGDTGQRNRNGGQIVIARHIGTQEIVERPVKYFVSGGMTGYPNDVSSFVRESSNPKNKTGYRSVIFDEQKTRWQVSIKYKGRIIRKFFRIFEDAVLYVNNFYVNEINPLIYDEKDKIQKIYHEKIKRNLYVTEKQKEIDETEFVRIKNARGYNWVESKNKWVARITIDGKPKNLGSFDTEEEAKAARKKAVDEYIKQIKQEKDDY